MFFLNLFLRLMQPAVIFLLLCAVQHAHTLEVNHGNSWNHAGWPMVDEYLDHTHTHFSIIGPSL